MSVLMETIVLLLVMQSKTFQWC